MTDFGFTYGGFKFQDGQLWGELLGCGCCSSPEPMTVEDIDHTLQDLEKAIAFLEETKRTIQQKEL